MQSKIKSTWLSYLNHIKSECHQNDELQITGFDEFLNANKFAHSFFKHSVPFVYLLDYRSGLYINMSENFAGYGSECFLKDGINHTLEIYEPDHLNLFNKEIFPDRLEILKDIKPIDHKNYIFSYKSRIKNRTGRYENYMQRSCFLSNADGDPIFSMGMLININDFSSISPIIQTVDRINSGSLPQHDTIFKKVYYLNQEDKIFSKREKEVLCWMAEGLSSKMIADKMFVSEHTVINHRRNMQDKANMPNAIALVSFAIKSGII